MLKQTATYRGMERGIIWRRSVISALRNRYLLMVAFFWLCKVRFGLWRFPFESLHQRLLLSRQKKLFYPFRTRPSLRQLIWSVNASSRLMPGEVKCLAKALCAQAIAHPFNYELDLHIGVAKQPNQSLEAHAWIVHQNSIILGNLPDLSRFVPLLSLPAQRFGGST